VVDFERLIKVRVGERLISAGTLEEMVLFIDELSDGKCSCPKTSVTEGCDNCKARILQLKLSH